MKELGCKYVIRCLSIENNRIIKNLESLKEIAENYIYDINYTFV